MSASYWQGECERWRTDAFIARYGHQDIHRLRGVESLSADEKLIFSAHLGHWLEAEVQPVDPPSGGGDPTTET